MSFTDIFSAVRTGTAEDVRLLVESGSADVNAKGRNDITPLHFAAVNGNIDIALILISAGANINAKVSEEGNCMTPLHIAIKGGKVECAKFLVNCGADLDAKTSEGFTPLHIAKGIGNAEIVEIIETKLSESNKESRESFTDIFSAVQRGTAEDVRHLIKAGADVNATGKGGITPLHYAADRGDIDIVWVLMEAWAKVNVQVSEEGGSMRPLDVAISAGNVECAKLLIDSGANLGASTSDGSTPLHAAAEKGDIETVRNLIAKDAEIDAKTSKEIGAMTPLHMAIMSGMTECAKYLIDKTPNLETRMGDGSTPLFLAIKKVNIELVKYLVFKKANINAENKGFTPLRVAMSVGNAEIIQILEDKLRENNQVTPSFSQESNSSTDLEKTLDAFEKSIHLLEDDFFNGGSSSAEKIEACLEGIAGPATQLYKHKKYIAELRKAGMHDMASRFTANLPPYSEIEPFIESLSDRKSEFNTLLNRTKNEALAPIKATLTIMSEESYGNSRILSLLDRCQKCIDEINKICYDIIPYAGDEKAKERRRKAEEEKKEQKRHEAEERRREEEKRKEQERRARETPEERSKREAEERKANAKRNAVLLVQDIRDGIIRISPIVFAVLTLIVIWVRSMMCPYGPELGSAIVLTILYTAPFLIVYRWNESCLGIIAVVVFVILNGLLLFGTVVVNNTPCHDECWYWQIALPVCSIAACLLAKFYPRDWHS